MVFVLVAICFFFFWKISLSYYTLKWELEEAFFICFLIEIETSKKKAKRWICSPYSTQKKKQIKKKKRKVKKKTNPEKKYIKKNLFDSIVQQFCDRYYPLFEFTTFNRSAMKLSAHDDDNSRTNRVANAPMNFIGEQVHQPRQTFEQITRRCSFFFKLVFFFLNKWVIIVAALIFLCGEWKNK